MFEMEGEEQRAKELGELFEEIGKRLIADPFEELGYEDLVKGRKSGRLIIDHFKLQVCLNDATYQVYGKFKKWGRKKKLRITEAMIIRSEEQ